MTKRTWAISGYHYSQKPTQGGIIASSIGMPLRELQKIARSMCYNGEGQRYAVVETVKP